MSLWEKIKELRQMLHACPECSGKERKTKQLLQSFLQEHTTLELHPCGSGFYAAHRETGAEDGIVLRADYDAVALPNGTAAHLCGHDGHAAALCGVALLLEGQCVGRDVFLLFQPAEETGEGAKDCCAIFQRESVSEIYGIHNLPGFSFGKVFTKPGTFACASQGVLLRFLGKATHAAYPEYGISPAVAVGKFLSGLEDCNCREQDGGMVLCTVIGIQMGKMAFGLAPADAEIGLTLRSEHNADMELLFHRVVTRAKTLAEQYHLQCEVEVQDVFPATENDPACAQKVLQRCSGSVLEVPMRWSEDFGYYTQQCPGAFLGIGAGEEQAQLHTAAYTYPDALLRPTVEAFWKLL